MRALRKHERLEPVCARLADRGHSGALGAGVAAREESLSGASKDHQAVAAIHLWDPSLPFIAPRLDSGCRRGM